MKRSQFKMILTSCLSMSFGLVAFNNCSESQFQKPSAPSKESASRPSSTTSEQFDTSDDQPIVLDQVTPTAQAPRITTQPSSLEVLEGDTAILSVATESSTGLQYQWYKGDVAMSGATSNTFVIQSASADSIGEYWVKVSNSGGETDSARALVTVQLTPSTFSFGANGIRSWDAAKVVAQQDFTLKATQEVDLEVRTINCNPMPAALFTALLRNEAGDIVFSKLTPYTGFHGSCNNNYGFTESIELPPGSYSMELLSQNTCQDLARCDLRWSLSSD